MDSTVGDILYKPHPYCTQNTAIMYQQHMLYNMTQGFWGMAAWQCRRRSISSYSPLV